MFVSKKNPTTSGLTILLITDDRLIINYYISFYDIHCKLRCLWVTSRGMKNSSTTLLMNARVFHYIHDRGWLLSMYICILMLMALYESHTFFMYTYRHLQFIIEPFLWVAWFTKIQLEYREFLEFVANTHDSWFEWKVHLRDSPPPWLRK